MITVAESRRVLWRSVRGYTRISLQGRVVVLDGARDEPDAILNVAEIEDVRARTGIGTRLALSLSDGRSYRIRGLPRKRARRLVRDIELAANRVAGEQAKRYRSLVGRLRREAVGSTDDDLDRLHRDVAGVVEREPGEFVFGRMGSHARLAYVSLRRIATREQFGDAVAAANRLVDLVGAVSARLDRLVDGTSYIRHSTSVSVLQELRRWVAEAVSSDDLLVPEERVAELRRLRSMTDDPEWRDACLGANERYLAAQRVLVADSLRNAGITPTREQTVAMATDEDATLVLAGAGTGKTTVIVGKVVHLARDLGVDPREILVLAYNDAAAGEIRTRLPRDIKGTRVHTFHSFGMAVIAGSTRRKPRISAFADDGGRMANLIDGIITELTGTGLGPRLLRYLTTDRQPYRSPFDFDSLSDYYDHVRTTQRLTLSGTVVRSFEEVLVANFLTSNGVRFRYEQSYERDTATSRHRQYCPDFHLPDHDIYIEHFALDEQDNAPPHFVGYAEGVAWKREIHGRYGTTLIETKSWQCRQPGILHDHLREALRSRGVRMREVGSEELLAMLREYAGPLLDPLNRLLRTAIRHVKNSALSIAEVRKGAKGQRELAFLDVLEEVLRRYNGALDREGACDFEDLINAARDQIRNGAWKPAFRYVLVDEFQDISKGRMELIAALKGPGVAYFLVGDDWQSIYRFAGGDVGLVKDCGRWLGLVKDCGRWLGHVRRLEIATVFRYGHRILGPTSTFVVRNPEQIRRKLDSGGRTNRTRNTSGFARRRRSCARRGIAIIGL